MIREDPDDPHISNILKLPGPRHRNAPGGMTYKVLLARLVFLQSSFEYPSLTRKNNHYFLVTSYIFPTYYLQAYLV